MDPKNNSGEKNSGCFGYCRRCEQVHSLDGGPARNHAKDLMKKLDTFGHIDFFKPSSRPDSRCSTESLFSSARGKMFGVLLCRDARGKEIVLYAFSGQFNGRWQVPGWVGPLFDVPAFHRCQDEREREIKALGRAMDEELKGSDAWKALKSQRRQLSRTLMQDIFSLYQLPNFRGEERSLQKVFAGEAGIPTGTGDCCAPKLLAHAARNNLIPLSLAEYYYGRENASASCVHRHFYLPCTARCQPILGHMLCGIEASL